MSSDQSKSVEAGWVEGKSANGVIYSVRGPGNQARQNTANTEALDVKAKASSDHNHFSFDIDWRFGDGTYTNTEPEFRKRTYISQYAVHKNPEKLWFDYMLELDLDDGAYQNYYFTDKEPGIYWRRGAGGGITSLSSTRRTRTSPRWKGSRFLLLRRHRPALARSNCHSLCVPD
jgi:hypothetical protein